MRAWAGMTPRDCSKCSPGRSRRAASSPRPEAGSLAGSMSPPIETIALAALIVAGAYVVFGLTGFGSTVLAVPLLALILPLKFAVSLMMLLDLAATFMLGARLRKGIR